MKFAGSSVIVLTLAAALAATATPAAAAVQQLAGGYLTGSFPTGDWGKIAGFGLGLDATDVLKKDTTKWFSMRSNFGVNYNFSRTVDVPVANVGPSDKLSIETKNWSLLFGIGPELSAPNKAVTPFVFGTVGFDTYWTGSELSGTAGGTSYSAEHGDSRISFAWGAGGGIRREVVKGSWTELSLEYRSGTDHQYLRPDDVTVSGGVVKADRTSHQSDQFLIRLGTVFGATK
jgi:opacity protein-like surface antigen